MPEPLLVARELSCRYERRWTLRRVSLSVQRGCLVALVGDNGAGKSTLLRLLAGVQRPAEGGTHIAGLAVSTPLPAPLRSSVAYLGHHVFVYADLTGLENITFFLGLYGGSAGLDQAKAIIARVGLEAAGNAQVKTYSRGMVQRLALGRLLAQQADLWLLDEPTTGLDVSGIAMLRGLLRELAERGGAAIVATHDIERFETDFSGRITLRGGRIVEGGVTP